MPRDVAIRPIEARRSQRRRIRDAAMEAGVVLSLMLAILAIACTFGIDRAAAAEIDPAMMVDPGSRFAIGAVLLSIFAGLCVLTTFMLRNTATPARQERTARRRSRLG